MFRLLFKAIFQDPLSQLVHIEHDPIFGKGNSGHKGGKGRLRVDKDVFDFSHIHILLQGLLLIFIRESLVDEELLSEEGDGWVVSGPLPIIDGVKSLRPVLGQLQVVLGLEVILLSEAFSHP